MTNVEAYSTFSSIGSDHRILTARIKLKLRSAKTPPRRKKFDWKALRSLYSITVRNRFDELSSVNDNPTVSYGHLITANDEVADKLIPTKKKVMRKNLSNHPNVSVARSRVQNAFKAYTTNETRDSQALLQREKENLDEVYTVLMEEDLTKMIERVEKASSISKHGESWKLINEITGRMCAQKGILKRKSKDDRVKQWHSYFCNLLGKEPTIDGEIPSTIPQIIEDLDIYTGPFTIQEFQTVKKALVEGKTAGPDGIAPEVLKRCDLDDIILGFANDLIGNGNKPDQWSTVDIIPLPKKGSLNIPGNYRGIGLSPIAVKMVNKMILNRIQPELDQHLRPNQNGFRPGRSTTSHILALRRVIEGVKSNNLKAIITFVDFQKAFDSVHRGMMRNILTAYGIPEILVNTIMKLYQGTMAKVISPDGDTELFEILAGVLQGDTLAPYLFAIVLDYCMRMAVDGREEELGFTIERRRSRRYPPVMVTDRDFADDIALLSAEIEQAQELLSRVEQEAEKIGLHLNAGKTEVMTFTQDTPVELKARCGDTIKVVENFKYLGAWMKSTDSDIKIRKALAWAACHKLDKIWTSKLSRYLKVRLFVATVETVLLYGSAAWTVTKAMEKKLDGCYTRMLRRALNVSWRQHMTNKELYGDLPPVTIKIKQQRLRLAGHCVRHNDEVASRVVLWQPSTGRVNRGRRRTTYVDTLFSDTGYEDVACLERAMKDRDNWKIFVEGVRPKGRRR